MADGAEDWQKWCVTSNICYQDKFYHHHIGDHSALDTGQGQIAFSPTFSLKMGSQFYIRKYFSNSSPFSVMRFLIYVVQENSEISNIGDT